MSDYGLIPEAEGDAIYPRDDGRTVHRQLHSKHRIEAGARVPDRDGNISGFLRLGDLIEFLSTLDDRMCLSMDDGDGPENGPTPLFEVVTAYDDPDPYEVLVIRPHPHRR